VRINEGNALNIPKPQSGKVEEPIRATRQSGAKRTDATRSGDDGIELGSQSGLLSQTQQAGASDREARVQELRALVQSGKYQVDTQALSNSIVGSTLNGY
jgi:flagellar biosynthesis anti-sigma factor FlgM